MKTREMDMTQGSPLKLVLALALPILLTNFGQQFYQIADAAIIGRGVGVRALAAVGSADWSCWLVLWGVMGLTQGFSVFVAQYYGRKDFVLMNRAIAMSTVLCALIGCAMTLVGAFVARPLLVLLGTPTDILADATVYLEVMIAGTAAITAYNMAASVLRAFGDGRTPLWAMGIAAAVNIGLDLLFVFAFHWGVFGVAIASVIAQAISFVYCLRRIRCVSCVRLDAEAWRPDRRMILDLLRLGLPFAFQHVVIAVGGIVLQSAINAQGSAFVAGFTATNKLYGLLECSAISLGLAFSTYLSQNFGAGLYDRFRKGVRLGVGLMFAIVPILMAVILPLGEPLLRLFIDAGENVGAEALTIAWRYLRNMVLLHIFLYLIYVYRTALLSAGDALWPMVSGFAETGTRVLVALWAVRTFGVDVLFFVEPAAWITSVVFNAVPYYCKRLGSLRR